MPHRSFSQTALMDAELCANCVLRAGVLLMSSGAEVYRVEETMTRLGESVPGVEECTSYVMVTGILCSVQMEGVTVTRMARIHSTSRNLSLICAVNALSRQAEANHYSADKLMDLLDEAEQTSDYSPFSKALWGAIGAAGFSIFFGGSPVDIALVFVVGLLVRFCSVMLEKIRINDYLVNLFLAFVIAASAVAFDHWIPAANRSNIIISAIMLLVPGLMITNALRDSVMDEPLSAMVLLTEAILIACSIAIGVLIGLYMMEGLL